MEYPKIDTLFERGEDFTVRVDQIKRPVLGTISTWDITEKIDGMNMRVVLEEDGSMRFAGRTDNAQIPGDLLQWLSKRFSADALKEVFWHDGGPKKIVLYGEGYGAGIQKGAAYGPTKQFILFDVNVGGTWLERLGVIEIADLFFIDTVPYLGQGTLGDIVSMVATPFPSKIGNGLAEGVVGRPIETLFDKFGNRIIIKLKTKDFKPGKR